MTTPTQGEHAQTALAHELFAAAQLAPGEGIEDAVSRIAAALTASPHPPRVSPEMVDSLERAADTLERLKALGSRVKHLDDTPAQPAAPQGVAYAEPSEFPAGAIVNGRTHIDRLESFYSFDCEAGPLINCDDWHGLKRCFEHLAERASHGQAPAGAVPDEQMIAEYGIKASRMMARDLTRFDAACEVDKYLREQGAPGYYRHRMSIILFGNEEGTEASRAPENSEPSTTAQAAPAAGAVAGPTREQIRDVFLANGFTVKEGQTDLKPYVYAAAEALLALAAAPTPAAPAADSVLEDAARWQFVESAPSAITLRLHNLRPDQRAQYVDAALKQGANHDNH